MVKINTKEHIPGITGEYLLGKELKFYKHLCDASNLYSLGGVCDNFSDY